jgi:hypothetical protein
MDTRGIVNNVSEILAVTVIGEALTKRNTRLNSMEGDHL